MFFGAWSRFNVVTVVALWGALGIGAVYMTRAIRNILHGPLGDKWMAVAEDTWPLRKLPYLILLVSLLVFGFFPHLLSDRIKVAAQEIVPGAARMTAVPAMNATGGGNATVVADVKR